MAAIAMMGKLEGLGAVPFSYGTLEFATNEGIDALCDLKLSDTDRSTFARLWNTNFRSRTS